MDESTLARFMAKVQKQTKITSPHVDTPCWLWTACTTGAGYGQLRVDGSAEYAHRLSHAHWVGPVCDMHVLHRCDVRGCCNPEHLFLGTNADNIADMEAKGRRRWGTSRGVANGFARLTPGAVRTARRDHALGKSITDIARDAGVSRTAISRAIKHVTWRHVM